MLSSLSISDLPDTFLHLGSGSIFDVRVAVLILVGLFAIAGFVLEYTVRNPMKKLLGVVPVVGWDEMNRRAEQILWERLNHGINPTARVEFLSGVDARPSASRANWSPIPTSSSSPSRRRRCRPTRRAASRNASRRSRRKRAFRSSSATTMDELFNITDRITVLDSGKLVDTVDTDDVTRRDVVEMRVSVTMPD